MTSILSATLLLFLVIDPLGDIPVFLSVLKNIDPRRHRHIIVRELCIGLSVLMVFLFAGQYILAILGISQSSLGIAGGIILFLIAVKMIFVGSEHIFESAADGEPFIVPLAIPSIAGPSATATVILVMARNPARWYEWLIALIGAWSIAGIILLLSDRLSRFLGHRGLIAIERLMGMILTTVAVEMFIHGIRQSFFN
jgi:multiple antibiotic resistance protein